MVGSRPQLLGRVLHRIPVPIASPVVGRGWRWCRVWGSLPPAKPSGEGGTALIPVQRELGWSPEVNLLQITSGGQDGAAG